MKVRSGFPIAALLAAAFCSGCDVLDSKQFVLPNASATDRLTIKRAIKSTAIGAGLSDRTQTSITPDTIAYYTDPNNQFRVSLGARMVKTSAVIDLSCFHPGPGTSPLFKKVDLSLTDTLTHEFGARLTIPDRHHMVP